ncbi:Putative ribonuclease H protein At1g65750 [Linum perenne]
MQTYVLPSHICESIDKKIRNFVWGSSDDYKKIHLVFWDTICKPKDRRGLGMRKVKELNFAYMMKLAFLFFKSPNDMWVHVLQHNISEMVPKVWSQRTVPAFHHFGGPLNGRHLL